MIKGYPSYQYNSEICIPCLLGEIMEFFLRALIT